MQSAVRNGHSLHFGNCCLVWGLRMRSGRSHIKRRQGFNCPVTTTILPFFFETPRLPIYIAGLLFFYKSHGTFKNFSWMFLCLGSRRHRNAFFPTSYAGPPAWLRGREDTGCAFVLQLLFKFWNGSHATQKTKGAISTVRSPPIPLFQMLPALKYSSHHLARVTRRGPRGATAESHKIGRRKTWDAFLLLDGIPRASLFELMNKHHGNDLHQRTLAWSCINLIYKADSRVYIYISPPSPLLLLQSMTLTGADSKP